MADDDRLDLNADLDKVGGDFLKDIHAATEEAKKRKASDIATDRRNAGREKDRKTSAIIIAAAAVVLLVIAYFAVFAKEPAPVAPPVNNPQSINTKVNPVAGRVTPAPQAPPRPTPAQNGGRQADQQPYGDDSAPGQ